MKANRKLIQIFLISIGFLIIIGTYLLYPKIEQNRLKDSVVENEPIPKNVEDDDLGSKFEELEFRGFYNFDNPFTIVSEKANISNEDPDIVHMTNMKVTQDCYLENNVVATDSETQILSDNLNLLSSKDSATIFNNVEVNSKNGRLKADKVDYNFESKYYKVSMFKDERIKIKLIE